MLRMASRNLTLTNSTRLTLIAYVRVLSPLETAGIYVSIMLFQGFALQFNRSISDGFPLDGRNNINGVDAGTGYAAHTLKIPAVTARQEEYVRRDH